MAKRLGTFWDYIISRENKVQTFFLRVHWLSEKGNIRLMATRNPGINSPVEGQVVEIYHYLPGFYVYIPGGDRRISEPSTFGGGNEENIVKFPSNI